MMWFKLISTPGFDYTFVSDGFIIYSNEFIFVSYGFTIFLGWFALPQVSLPGKPQVCRAQTPEGSPGMKTGP